MDKLKERLYDFKVETKKKLVVGLQKTADFIEDNRDVLIVAVPVVFGLTKKIGRVRKDHRERAHREREYYDHSTGHWWILRKTPTTGQRLEIDRRRRSGESYAEIFSSMRLL